MTDSTPVEEPGPDVDPDLTVPDAPSISGDPSVPDAPSIADDPPGLPSEPDDPELAPL